MKEKSFSEFAQSLLGEVLGDCDVGDFRDAMMAAICHRLADHGWSLQECERSVAMMTRRSNEAMPELLWRVAEGVSRAHAAGADQKHCRLHASTAFAIEGVKVADALHSQREQMRESAAWN